MEIDRESGKSNWRQSGEANPPEEQSRKTDVKAENG